MLCLAVKFLEDLCTLFISLVLPLLPGYSFQAESSFATPELRLTVAIYTATIPRFNTTFIVIILPAAIYSGKSV